MRHALHLICNLPAKCLSGLPKAPIMPIYCVGRAARVWVILMIEVFFDGKCGLCSKEIAYYQSIAPSGIFAWMDIATDASPLAAHQISQADALRHLHVRDSGGNWHIGAAAFLVIWQQLRYWRFLAVLVGLPIIHQIAAMVYNRFANYRFAKLAHCQIAQKNLVKASTS